jgi:hypothetical protein
MGPRRGPRKAPPVIDPFIDEMRSALGRRRRRPLDARPSTSATPAPCSFRGALVPRLPVCARGYTAADIGVSIMTASGCVLCGACHCLRGLGNSTVLAADAGSPRTEIAAAEGARSLSQAPIHDHGIVGT